METKNIIIQNYTNSLVNIVNLLNGTALMLGDNMDENRSILKSLNVILESVRSETINTQNAIDTY